MCGLTSVFNLNGVPVSLQLMQNITHSIAHRGMDDKGYFVEENIGLGHRRLSILDLSSLGTQPMMSKDKKWVVIFNGCIYNFLELRLELQSLGHHFVSNCDTEVLVEGLARYGKQFLQKINGMFAIVAWHQERKELLLARDRFGVKPLYYWFNKKTLVVASEIKVILQHPDYQIGVNLSVLNEYFTFQNLFRYETMFKDIHMLPAANAIVVNKQTSVIQHHAWWDYDFSQPDNQMTFEDAKEQTQKLLTQAVNRQMIADVPVGSYLSGGMDSGSLVGLASKHVPRLCTFTAGFELSEVTGVEAMFDERIDAELIANYYKTEHYEQVINAGDLKWSLPKVVWHLEDLRVGMSYPNYYISRLASKFVKVCLQGTGGDELFGGYPWRYYRVFDSLNQKAFFENYYGFWQRLVPDNQKQSLFQNHIYQHINLDEPRQIFERVFKFNPHLKYNTPEEHIQNSLYFEIKTFLNGLLIVGDKLSMANGLEERFPFLDNDLVNFAQKVPVRHKLANLEQMKRIDENAFGKKRLSFQQYDDGKNVLRKAMRDILPEKILNRKKQGFSAPDESWYRGENASYIKDLLLNKNVVYQEFINPKYVYKIVDEHINHRINHRLLIWSLMCFEWWCKLFLHHEKF